MDANRSFLLPHRWQVVGGWMVVAAIPLAMAIIACDVAGFIRNVPVMLTWIPAYVGLLLICLSKEKVDDEYICNVRSRLVCQLVAIAIMAKILGLISEVMGINFGWLSFAGGVRFLSVLYNPIVLAVVYVIALKLRLYVLNRKMKEYAGQ